MGRSVWLDRRPQHLGERKSCDQHYRESDADQLGVPSDALARLVKRDEYDEHREEQDKQRSDDRVTKARLDLLAQPNHPREASERAGSAFEDPVKSTRLIDTALEEARGCMP